MSISTLSLFHISGLSTAIVKHQLGTSVAPECLKDQAGTEEAKCESPAEYPLNQVTLLQYYAVQREWRS
uniref:Secreted protein n=1 Tax=Ascaris lumbricoides TaxID=6252 RepID=A0A0M3IG87_ASCLU